MQRSPPARPRPHPEPTAPGSVSISSSRSALSKVCMARLLRSRRSRGRSRVNRCSAGGTPHPAAHALQPIPRALRPTPRLSEPAVCPREPRFLPPVRLSGRGAQTWAGRHAWVSAPPCLRSGQRPLWCHSRVLSVYVMNIRPQEWDMIAAQHAPEAPARPARHPLSPCGPRWRLWPRPRTHAKATATCCAPNGFPPMARPSPKKCGGASFLGHLSILTLKGSDPRPPAPGAAGAGPNARRGRHPGPCALETEPRGRRRARGGDGGLARAPGCERRRRRGTPGNPAPGGALGAGRGRLVTAAPPT